MNSLYFKRIGGRLAARDIPQGNRRVVLLYHAVGRGPNAVSRQLFQSQMEWLAEHADVLALADLVGGGGVQPLRVSIGFDDGYASVVDHAEPVLRALNMPATVYLNTGRIKETVRCASDPALGHYPGEQFMTWEDVNRLAQRRWTIGSHGVEHVDLTAVTAGSLVTELGDSKRAIEMHLGVACHHFAYTWGRFNDMVRHATASAGYLTAASALHAPVTTSSDFFALPRMDVRNSYSLDDFQLIVRGHWDFLGRIQQLRRLAYRRLWRSR